MKIGVTTFGSGGILGMAEEAKEAEEAGFDLFVVPSIYGHDPVSVATVAEGEAPTQPCWSAKSKVCPPSI